MQKINIIFSKKKKYHLTNLNLCFSNLQFFRILTNTTIKITRFSRKCNLNKFYLSCLLHFYMEQKLILITLKLIYLTELNYSLSDLFFFIECIMYSLLQKPETTFFFFFFFQQILFLSKLNINNILIILLKLRFYILRLLFKSMIEDFILERFSFLKIMTFKKLSVFYKKKKKFLNKNNIQLIFSNNLFLQINFFIIIENYITQKILDYLLIFFFYHNQQTSILTIYDIMNLNLNYLQVFNDLFKPYILKLCNYPLYFFLAKNFHYELYNIISYFLYLNNYLYIQNNKGILCFVNNIFFFFFKKYLKILKKPINNFFIEYDNWEILFLEKLQNKFSYYYYFFLDSISQDMINTYYINNLFLIDDISCK